LKPKFLTPNRITQKRADRLLTKEPDTIRWIDNMSGILYDIGANVGTYSIYAGLRGITVYAFEPEASNYALLNENIKNNNLDNVLAYCLALSDRHEYDSLYLSTTEVGGSLHAFGEKLDYKLQHFNPVFRQGCMSVTLDEINLPKPDHIKIDVDGFEHLVVAGGMGKIMDAQSVLIEINHNLKEHEQIIDILVELGFTVNQREAEEATRKHGPMTGVGNVIFRK